MPMRVHVLFPGYAAYFDLGLRVCLWQKQNTANAVLGSSARVTRVRTAANSIAAAAPAPPASSGAPTQARQAHPSQQSTPRLVQSQEAELERTLQTLSKQFDDQQQALLRGINAATGEDILQKRLTRACGKLVDISQQTAQALRSARKVGRGGDGEQAIRDAGVRVVAGVRFAPVVAVLVAVSCWSPCRVGRRVVLVAVGVRHGHLLTASLTVWLRRVQVREVSEGLVESATRLLCSQRKAAGDAYMMLGQVRTRFAKALKCFDQAVTLFKVRTPHRVPVDCSKCLTACMMLWVAWLGGWGVHRWRTLAATSHVTACTTHTAVTCHAMSPSYAPRRHLAWPSTRSWRKLRASAHAHSVA